jgi:hypothetical protein
MASREDVLALSKGPIDIGQGKPAFDVLINLSSTL